MISSSLDRDLISEGYLVKRIINYTVLPIEEISDEFIKDLKCLFHLMKLISLFQ